MPTRWFLPFCLLTVCRELVVPVSSTYLKSLDVVHEWKYIDYDFTNDAHRQAAIKSGDYDYKNCVPIDMDRWKDKTFVTVMNDYGVPASLTVVTKKKGPGGPLLMPYPDWSWAENKNCTGVTSAYAIAVDMCDRLWVVDAGLFADVQICRPRLLIFNLRKSTLLGDIEIPEDTSPNRSSMYGRLTNIVVKTSGLDCSNTTAYISDTMGAGLIVYNGHRMLRLNSWDLKRDSNAAVQSAEKDSRRKGCGIAAMGLSSLTQNLYFTALSSSDLGVANTDLNDDSSTCRNLQFDAFGNLFGTESTALAVSKTGAVFFGLADGASIACWSEYRSLKKNNTEVISRDCSTLEFISSMKVQHLYPEEELWVFSSMYRKDADCGYDFDKINFRIHRRDVNALIRGTCCRPNNV